MKKLLICLSLLFLVSCTPKEGVDLIVHPGDLKVTMGLLEDSITQLSVEVIPAGSPAELVWSSANPQVARVGEYGLVTALQPGNVRIYVTDLQTGAKGSCLLRVYTVPQELNFRLSAGTLFVGEKLNLKPKLVPAKNIQKIHTIIQWNSTDPHVATVDSRGHVTGLSKGTAVISGRTVNGLTTSCEIEVGG